MPDRVVDIIADRIGGQPSGPRGAPEGGPRMNQDPQATGRSTAAVADRGRRRLQPARQLRRRGSPIGLADAGASGRRLTPPSDGPRLRGASRGRRDTGNSSVSAHRRAPRPLTRSPRSRVSVALGDLTAAGGACGRRTGWARPILTALRDPPTLVSSATPRTYSVLCQWASPESIRRRTDRSTTGRGSRAAAVAWPGRRSLPTSHRGHGTNSVTGGLLPRTVKDIGLGRRAVPSSRPIVAQVPQLFGEEAISRVAMLKPLASDPGRRWNTWPSSSSGDYAAVQRRTGRGARPWRSSTTMA